MFSERMNDGIERDPEQYFKRYNAKYPEYGGAREATTKGTATERKEALKSLQTATISMKSLAAQGIDRKAVADREAAEFVRVYQAE